MKYRITSQKQLRAAFWAAHPAADRKRITDYEGTGKMYRTDTRTAWVEYVDAMSRDNQISQALASRATLEG